MLRQGMLRLELLRWLADRHLCRIHDFSSQLRQRDALLFCGAGAIFLLICRLWSVCVPRMRLAESRLNSMVSTVTIFKQGEDGYAIFRIPSLLAVPAPDGGNVLLAFAEARASVRDWGRIDLVLKRAVDNGRSWSGIHVVADAQKVGLPEGSTVGNPCSVYDAVRQRVVRVLTTNRGEDNEARTWSG